MESDTYIEIQDLREVPLSKRDFAMLREVYGASKHGTHSEHAMLIKEISPSYRMAAQRDLDHFHAGDEHFLPWDDLIEEMWPSSDDRTPEDRRQDQLAMTFDKG